MKKLLCLICLTITIFAQDAAAQKSREKSSNLKPGAVKSSRGVEVIKRGAALNSKTKKISLAEALQNPESVAGKVVKVSGVIVRSCKMEGCWMQLAPTKTAKSVRVTFDNHKFLIPLTSEGMNAIAEGTFAVKKLSKEEVKHLVEDDGAKFDNIAADGTVTQVEFVAKGVELRK